MAACSPDYERSVTHDARSVFAPLLNTLSLPTGGGDIFDDHHPVGLFEHAFKLLGGAVVFLLVADEQAGDARGHGGGGDQGDPAQFRPRQAGHALDGRHLLGEHLPQGREDVRLGREQLLVEVVADLAPAAEGELAPEEGDFRNPARDFLSRHHRGHAVMVPGTAALSKRQRHSEPGRPRPRRPPTRRGDLPA